MLTRSTTRPAASLDVSLASTSAATGTSTFRSDERYWSLNIDHESKSQNNTSACPIATIRKIVRNSKSKQKTCRIALWYAAYQLFRRSWKALLPRRDEIGTWKRDAPEHENKKLGRHNRRNGKFSGHSAIPLAASIVTSFWKFAKLRVPIAEIYRQSMTGVFGCKTRVNARGLDEFYHPTGKPFPSFGQYRYHVLKEVGLRTVQVQKLGAVTVRNRVQISKGPFSESVTNAFERSETDAYFSKVAPTALLHDGPDLPLVISRIVCLATGLRFGIGASYGSERAEAYRAMLFCAAVNKQRFARIIGLEIGPNDAPYEGLPIGLVADRGPGCTQRATPSDGPSLLPDRGMTPSHEPQSKGTVESSHRREAVIEGPPGYVQSSLTAIELYRKEFLQMIVENKSSDASARMTPEMVADGIPATPLSIYRWLNDRGRSDAYKIPFDEAVRQFLEPVTFELNSDGLWLLSLRYDSPDFAAFRSRLSKGVKLEVKGFVLPLCVRTAWLDVGDRLIEVYARLPLRDDGEQRDMSLSELRAMDTGLKGLKAEIREHVPAARAAGAQSFTDQTGKSWDAATRKKGRKPSRKSRGPPGVPSPHRRPRKRK